MDAARKYVDKGQADRAIKEYLRVVREDPNDVRVWLKIGDLHVKKGAKQEATETYLKVAKYYSEQGFYLKAVAVYKQILKLDARLVEVNLKLAELYRQLGLLSDAMQHFEMVAAHFNREGKTKEALATVRQLVDLDPENIATRIKLAELYSKEGLMEQAVTEFGHACEYLRSHNRQDDFIKVAERLLWHKPDNLDLNRELATLYLHRSDPRRALQKLQVCFKANQRDVETLALLAQAFQALSQKGKTVSVLKEMARILHEDGDKKKAQEVHRKILMFAPDDPDSQAYLGQSSRVETPPPPLPDRRLFTQGDVQHKRHNPTGSVPLLREPPAPVDDVDDFVADLSLDDDASFDTGSMAGELHEAEISKILNETVIYVKYGLHQKAIDHLKRVFELDPDNAEAREQLKEIYINQGRDDEAIDLLLQLAEQVAASNPSQAEGYLRDVLALDGTCEQAYQLAHRFKLEVAAGPAVEIIDDLSDAVELMPDDGAVVPVDEEEIDFDDLSLGGDDNLGNAPEPMDLDAALEFDLDELSAELVTPPPSPAQPDTDLLQTRDPYDDAPGPIEPAYQAPGGSESSVSQPYELDAGQVGAGEFDLDGLAPAVSEPHPQVGISQHEPPSVTQEVSLDQVEASMPARVNDELDFDSAVLDDVGFDPDDARAFDAELGYAAARERENYASAEPAANPQGYDDIAEPPAPHAEPLLHDSDTFAPIDYEAAGEVSPAPAHLPAEPSERTVIPADHDSVPPDIFDAEPISDVAGIREDFEGDFGVARPPRSPDEPTFAARPQTLDPGEGFEVIEEQTATATVDSQGLEDDLDEADFFMAQGLLGEASDILQGLLAQYPNHPLITAKLQDLKAAQTDSPVDFGGETDEISAHELEHALVAAEAAEVDDPLRPKVMLEKPIDDEDAETHYDLGLAYKEMGLYDEAIKAFEKVVVSAAREAQCRLMMGLCHREQGAFSEAIHAFKAGLHASALTEAERLSLYYEIASSYEAMGDRGEAQYFLEMLLKSDPSYRDAPQRLEQLKSQAASG